MAEKNPVLVKGMNFNKIDIHMRINSPELKDAYRIEGKDTIVKISQSLGVPNLV